MTKEAPVLIFDFDSTIVSCETLEIMAMGDAKKLEQIQALTNGAMSGELSYQASLNKRLEILKLNKTTLIKGIALIKKQLSSGFDAFINKLNNEQLSRIYIVSGGFKEVIGPICPKIYTLGNVYANTLIINKAPSEDNFYQVDKENPLSQNLGKVKVIQEHIAPIYPEAPIIVIGDGYTDLEIKLHFNKTTRANIKSNIDNEKHEKHKKPEKYEKNDEKAENKIYFIAYTQTIDRPEISSRADAIANNFDEVISILQKGILWKSYF